MHSSYQLNTVFTDVCFFFVLPYTPTELQVSSSCNVTNQPLFLRNHPAAVEPVLHGAQRGLRGSPSGSAAERELMEGAGPGGARRVCLQLGCTLLFFHFYWRRQKANHTVYHTPESPVQQFCCICFICQNS